MRWPDFLIVGAPKCGTTAMADYLRRHPEVFLPRRKELNFFGGDLVFRRSRMTETEYLGVFARARQDQRIGEASVWTLLSETAATEIHGVRPDAKIIIMLRNPVDMMHSLHSQRVYNGTENLFDFEEALDAEEDRRSGFRLPARWDNRMGYDYRAAARYTSQVERFLRTFGRANVSVILFDDFRGRTEDVYRETCHFLGIDPDLREDLAVVNGNKRTRSDRLRDFIRFASPRSRAIVRTVVPHPALRTGLKLRFKRLNTRYEPRRPMDPALRERLRREFRAEVEALGRLIERDLGAWNAPAPVPAGAGNDRPRTETRAHE